MSRVPPCRPRRTLPGVRSLLCRSLGVPAAVSDHGVRDALVIRLVRVSGHQGEIGPEQRQDADSAIAAVERGLAHGALDRLLIGEDDPERVVEALVARVQGYVDGRRLRRYTGLAIDAVVTRARAETDGGAAPA